MPEPFVFIIHFTVPGATDPDEFAVRVYDAESLQDMSLMGPDNYGSFEAEFERVGGSLPNAILTALRDLSAVLPEAQILRVEDEGLVSLGAIARRLDRTHESVRLYARHKRGPGNFPAPVGKIDDKTEVWNWSDVAAWWKAAHGEPVAGWRESVFLNLINDVLDMRRATSYLSEEQGEEIGAIAEMLPGSVKQAVLSSA